MKIIPVPCLEDNYSYLIIDEISKEAATVDPVEPEKVLRICQENGCQLKIILTTHHHWDHAGGNEKMKELVPGITVYGGSLDNVKGCTNKLENGDKLFLSNDINILALHTPCHAFKRQEPEGEIIARKPHWLSTFKLFFYDYTLIFAFLPSYFSHTNGHISYYVTGKADEVPAAFTGDTLFIAGCGKFFEGTAEQMYRSLCVTLGSLPKPTWVYCGHEYTISNLLFALTVEPENTKLAQKLAWAHQKRQSGLPTVPSTIEEEWESNPFMRVELPEMQEKVGCKSAVEAIQKIRHLKDNWRRPA